MTAKQTQRCKLSSPVTAISGCAGARAQCLARLGITTVRDLVTWYPRRYIDMTKVVSCADAPIGEVATVVGRLEGVRQKHSRRGVSVIEAAVVDETGAVAAVWFSQPWMINKLHPGDTCSFTGKVSFNYGMKQMSSPMMEVIGSEDGAAHAAMIPVHRATEGLTPAWMRRLVAQALVQVGDLVDPLPADLRCKHRLMGRKAALRYMHFPATKDSQEQARRRLAYEEVLLLQLEMLSRRRAEQLGSGFTEHAAGASTRSLRARLPFELTAEQEAAVADIEQDMAAPKSMNRMLLGDVGTGKTIVAAFALCIASDSGGQAAMMAPTEVLAQQYAEKLGPLLDQAGVSWALLTGSTDKRERASIIEGAACGAIEVLFGTHVLIEPDVRFKNCTLLVIDEQHRFGVEQRAALRAKGPTSDLLVMTATPIPRTLALTLYGDLETSIIRERPANRPPVTTRTVSRSNRRHAYEAIRKELKAGRQAYIVCPLVGLTREQRKQASDDGTLFDALRGDGEIAAPKAAENEARRLSTEVFPQYEVGLLTGRMPAAQKREVMAAFKRGEIDILVSTTVVEVGVDVPNATVMMIEDADRFGLSQLHQLRGRVGRGLHPGQVFLVADPAKDDDALKARMDAMCTMDDGFTLAELDLKSRREGDVLGSRQHGASHLKLVNVIDDAELVMQAREDARGILDADSTLSAPEHRGLADELEEVFARIDSSISKGA